eukprot:gene12879-biopygen6993
MLADGAGGGHGTDSGGAHCCLLDGGGAADPARPPGHARRRPVQWWDTHSVQHFLPGTTFNVPPDPGRLSLEG